MVRNLVITGEHHLVDHIAFDDGLALAVRLGVGHKSSTPSSRCRDSAPGRSRRRAPELRNLQRQAHAVQIQPADDPNPLRSQAPLCLKDYDDGRGSKAKMKQTLEWPAYVTALGVLCLVVTPVVAEEQSTLAIVQYSIDNLGKL